jgi:predicted PurR-regulated permease PerM
MKPPHEKLPPPQQTTCTVCSDRSSCDSPRFKVHRRATSLTFWSWFRQTARLWGFLGFIIFILFTFRSVILPFLLALLVAYVLSPLIKWLNQLQVKGQTLPRFFWVLLIFSALIGMMALFFTYFVPRLSGDFKRIVQEVPALRKKARESYIPAVAEWLQKNFGEEPQKLPSGTKPSTADRSLPSIRLKRLPNGEFEVKLQDLQFEAVQTERGRWIVQVPKPDRQAEPSDRIDDSVNQYVKDFATRSVSWINKGVGWGQKALVGILSTITTFILVLMISAFLLVDTDRILKWFRNLVPKRYYEDFDNVLELIDKGLSGAIRGQFFICMINGVLTWIGLILFGVKYSLLLGLLAGVMSLIPIFGSILSSIPIVLVALASGENGISIIKGLIILMWIIGIHLLEANLLNPKIMGSAAKIHPVVVIFAVVAGERTYGAIGALLGVPLVSAVQAIFVYVRGKVHAAGDDEPENGQPEK